MAPRTLASTWKQYEKVFRGYERTDAPRKKAIDALNSLGRRVNRSRIVEALATLFVHPHPGMEEASVRFFTLDEGDEFPAWAARFSAEDNVIFVNPVGVFRFRQACSQAKELLRTPEGREDFAGYRRRAYLAELGKLPPRMMLFLLLLREVANARKISRVEKKGGEIELAEDEDYMNLLWAFKELESFYAASGQEIRSEYRIFWYESDWIIGK